MTVECARGTLLVVAVTAFILDGIEGEFQAQTT